MITLDDNTKKVIKLCEIFGVGYEIIPQFDPVRAITMYFYADNLINTFSDEVFVAIANFISKNLRYSDIKFRIAGKKGHHIWGKDIIFEQINGKYNFYIKETIHIERANIEDLEDAEEELIGKIEAMGFYGALWLEGGYSEGEAEVSYAIEIEDSTYNEFYLVEYMRLMERITKSRKIIEELIEPYVIDW